MFKDSVFNKDLDTSKNEEDVQWIRASKIAFKADEEGDVDMIRRTDEDGNDVDQSQEYCCDFEPNQLIQETMEYLGHELKDIMFKSNFDLGICSVVLKINGEKKRVVLDDFIPCIDGTPIYGQNKSNALWVTMVEKAIAKVNGGYKNISQEAGNFIDSFEFVDLVCSFCPNNL